MAEDCPLFGIDSTAGTFAIGAWLLFVIICSLLGDTTILVSSVKYKAFSLHKIVVAFIQHLAVADLVTNFGTLLPVFVTLCISGGCGDAMRLVIAVKYFVGLYVHSVSSFLIGAMTLSKLILLRHPLRTGSWSTRQVHKFCAGFWLALLIIPLLALVVNIKYINTSDEVMLSHVYMFDQDTWKILSPIMNATVFLVPNIIIVVSSLLLLMEARKVAIKSQQSLRWQGIVTVLLTAAVYTVSYLPYTVIVTAGAFLRKEQFVRWAR